MKVFMLSFLFVFKQLDLIVSDVFVAINDKYMPLNNIFITREAVVLDNGSLTNCICQCILERECMAVSYNSLSSRCIGVTVGLMVLDAIGYPETGWSYYIIKEERCPKIDGYVYSSLFRSCYKLHGYNSSLSYSEYDPSCSEEGGELLKIDSSEKQQHLTRFLDQYQPVDYIFFQGTHDLRENAWRFNDGTIMAYFNWHPTQPDSSHLPGQDIEVMCFQARYSYMWHDCWTFQKGAFLCEKIIPTM